MSRTGVGDKRDSEASDERRQRGVGYWQAQIGGTGLVELPLPSEAIGERERTGLLPFLVTAGQRRGNHDHTFPPLDLSTLRNRISMRSPSDACHFHGKSYLGSESSEPFSNPRFLYTTAWSSSPFWLFSFKLNSSYKNIRKVEVWKITSSSLLKLNRFWNEGLLLPTFTEMLTLYYVTSFTIYSESLKQERNLWLSHYHNLIREGEKRVPH